MKICFSRSARELVFSMFECKFLRGARAGARAGRFVNILFNYFITFIQRLVFFWAIFGGKLRSTGQDFYVFGDAFVFFPLLASFWSVFFHTSGLSVLPGIFGKFFAPAIVDLS